MKTTVYHFGYSSSIGEYVAFAYPSKNAFASERLAYGIGTKPPMEIDPNFQLPDGFINPIHRQRDHDWSLPIGEMVGIGDEIQFLVMTPGHFQLKVRGQVCC